MKYRDSSNINYAEMDKEISAIEAYIKDQTHLPIELELKSNEDRTWFRLYLTFMNKDLCSFNIVEYNEDRDRTSYYGLLDSGIRDDISTAIDTALKSTRYLRFFNQENK